ncbi:MAG: hypothetical protein SGBAC_003554 [Bacillariaceae sp.]
MTRETLGEVALNRQDNENDVPFFAPSQDFSDGEESVHPALKDAGILCEGQEAMWVEDDVGEILRRASSEEQYLSKKKKTFNLFRGKKKTQKAVVLLPPQPIDEDVENQENQLAPEDGQTPNKDINETHVDSNEDKQNQREEELGVKEGNAFVEEPQLESGEKTNLQEKENDVEDVVHGSIDIPDEILEEMKLQGGDAVEKARKDVDSKGSDSNSQISSLGLTTDSLDLEEEYGIGLEEEYGVEMNIPSSGNAVEIVGTGPMMLEPETIEQSTAGKATKGKKAKWGLLRMFKNKPKQQKVSPNSNEEAPLAKIEATEDDADETSQDSSVSKPETSEAKPVNDDSSCDEPDKYSVAAPKAALADDMEDSDDEDDALDTIHQPEQDDEQEEEDDVDDRYRIGPPKNSKSETKDDASVVSVEQEMIPNRAEDRKPVISLQVDCQEEVSPVHTLAENADGPSTVEQEMIPNRAEDRKPVISLPVDCQEEDLPVHTLAENADGPSSVDDSPELQVDEVDEVDETNIIVEQEEETEFNTVEGAIQDETIVKRKSRFVGMFGRRKTKKQNADKKISKKAFKTNEIVSVEPEADEVSKTQPDTSPKKKTPAESNRAERSPVASVKGDSMTVIADAINNGALMAIESNLEAEGTMKSRRLRTRADSSKDVIDLIRERTQNTGKRQDPLDSCSIGLRMSMSMDPSGKAMSEHKTAKEETNSLMHLAPTPRAKKTVDEKVEAEQHSRAVSHQQQITQRLYGITKGDSHLQPSKNIYVGDLLKGVSTDPTVDSAVSDEKTTHEVVAAN